MTEPDRPNRLLIPLLLVALSGCATAYGPDRQAPLLSRQDTQLMASNVGFGAVVGAVGAAVNGEGGTVWTRAGRGALAGAAGGAGLYAGKWVAGQVSVSESYAWGWPAVLIHEAGASVIENAALGRPALDRLSVHAGFVRLDVRPGTGAVQARLMALNAIAFGLMLADGHRLDVGKSALYGTPLFFGEERSSDPTGLVSERNVGFAFFNTVYIWEGGRDIYATAGHELVHILQHREYLRTGTWHARLDEPLRRSGTYAAAADWVYFDNAAAQAAVYYLLEGGPDFEGCYYDNWMEFEAEAFGDRTRIVC